MREINIDLLRLSEEIADCTAEACVLKVARRMEERSSAGVAVLDDFRSELGDDVPDCLDEAISEFRTTFSLLARMASALQAGDVPAVEKYGTRAGELEVEAQRDMASCLSSLGA
jgi:hypothetical protein